MPNLRLTYIVWCTVSLLLFAACATSSKYTRTGDQFRAKGNHDEASAYYYNALLKNRKNEKARSGLLQSGQVVLNEKFATFSKLVVDQKIEESMKQYGYAEKYAANAKSVGVDLAWPYEYEEVYEDIKQEYLGKLFDDALIMMNNRKYDLAEKQFERIATYDSSYQNVSVLRLHTVLEPLYNKGIRQLQTGKYPEAYKTFTRLMEIDDQFKDVKARKEEAAAKATSKVGIFPVQNLSASPGEENAIADMLNKRVKAGASFISLIPSDEIKRVIETRGFTTLPDQHTTLQAAKSVGLQYVIRVVLESASDSLEKAEKKERPAYEAFTENIPNPYTGTYTYISKFKKITYLDTYEARTVKYKVALYILRVADGATLFTENYTLEKKDQVHAYSYNGKVNNLYETLPADNQMPPPNQEWRERFFNDKRKLLGKDELSRELILDLADQVNKAVALYIK